MQEKPWYQRLAICMGISAAIVFTPFILMLLISILGNLACWTFGGAMCPPLHHY